MGFNKLLLDKFDIRDNNDVEDRYRILAENSSDVIYELDSQLRLPYISPAAEELFGYSTKREE
jgi:PAS domain S-box-containing protein